MKLNISYKNAKVKGLCLIVLGVVSILVGIVLGLALAYAFKDKVSPLIAFGCGLGIGGKIGVTLVNRGRKHFSRATSMEISSGGWPGVLYLRSFVDDDAMASVPGEDATIRLTVQFATQEEQLLNAVTDIGPVIAIGRPGEELPALGARRFYVEEARWKAEVSSAIDRANLVIVLLNNCTPGLSWEIRKIIKVKKPAHLILFTFAGEQQYIQELYGKIAQCFPKGLPQNIVLQKHHMGIMCRFSSDWAPSLVPVTEKTVPFFRRRSLSAITPAFRMALKPVFEAIDIEWNPPPISKATTIATAFFGLGILIILLEILHYLSRH